MLQLEVTCHNVNKNIARSSYHDQELNGNNEENNFFKAIKDSHEFGMPTDLSNLRFVLPAHQQMYCLIRRWEII